MSFRRFFRALIVSGALPGFVFAQTTTPLLQVLASNSPLDRPPIFREMQRQIGTEIEGLEPGLQADLIYDKMQDVRDLLLNTYDSLELDIEIVSRNSLQNELRVLQADTTRLADEGRQDELEETLSKLQSTRDLLKQDLVTVNKAVGGTESPVVNGEEYAVWFWVSVKNKEKRGLVLLPGSRRIPIHILKKRSLENPKALLDAFEQELAKALASRLNKVFSSIIDNNELQTAVASGLVAVLVEKKFVTGLETTSVRAGIDGLAEILAGSVAALAREAILEDFDGSGQPFYSLQSLLSDSGSRTKAVEQINALITRRISSFKTKTKEKLVTIVDRAEHKVTSTLGFATK